MNISGIKSQSIFQSRARRATGSASYVLSDPWTSWRALSAPERSPTGSADDFQFSFLSTS